MVQEVPLPIPTTTLPLTTLPPNNVTTTTSTAITTNSSIDNKDFLMQEREHGQYVEEPISFPDLCKMTIYTERAGLSCS